MLEIRIDFQLARLSNEKEEGNGGGRVGGVKIEVEHEPLSIY